ncbi:hypothetical protein [Streptomyces sp. NPDC008092]|uniref:hypothetical protein n=1 Tax=Streptomyces sp. NPDC008092 TaxID=3364808 RepID=UPI0036E6B37F
MTGILPPTTDNEPGHPCRTHRHQHLQRSARRHIRGAAAPVTTEKPVLPITG